MEPLDQTLGYPLCSCPPETKTPAGVIIPCTMCQYLSCMLLPKACCNLSFPVPFGFLYISFSTEAYPCSDAFVSSMAVSVCLLGACTFISGNSQRWIIAIRYEACLKVTRA